MLSLLSIIVCAAGAAVLFFMPLPRARLERIFQQGVGAVLFGLGLTGSIISLF